MVRGLVTLLLLQLLGEVMVRSFLLSVPGPVLGMALLVLVLSAWNRLKPMTDDAWTKSDVGRVSQGLLNHLALLFVPAGVGVVQYLHLVAEHGLALGIALIVSTVITLLATVVAFLVVKKAFPDQIESNA